MANAPSFSDILYSVEGGVATITLNRPDRLNSFTVEMHEALRTAFSDIEADVACRAVKLAPRWTER